MNSLKSIARYLKSLWMNFAHAVGWFNTRVLLTVVYFIVLAIPALILKIIRKDLLDRRWDKPHHRRGKTSASYWKTKEPVIHSLENSKHQF